MKVCSKCSTEKSRNDFYAHKAAKDGLLSACKECTKKAVKENRESKKDYYNAYERARAMLPHRVESRSRYQKTEAGIAAVSRAKKKYDSSPKKLAAIQRHRAKHPKKYMARQAVGNAIRDGRLARGSCEVCGDQKTHGHHDDYNKPLDVRWLCTTHHAAWHKENNPID